ncbi:hypothetical protein RJ639_032949 [Escallonia herrerae]|uniref:GAG-pre-integrase domain-containing protein n=1 Tax=Escallonia herrerae TaxID=1293975 RepID=A0AA88WWC2_9ASTE|nr:hypothetical protein RJ639_032949 [Escallonia herrerae]
MEMVKACSPKFESSHEKDALVVHAFFLPFTTVTGAAAEAQSSNIDSDTTNLGHMSKRGMDVLSKQDLLGSKKIGKLNFYEHCVFGKQCSVKFSGGVHTTKIQWIISIRIFGVLLRIDETFDESSMLSRKEELIDAAEDHSVRKKVELEV